ncbi:NUDIX domain-containing protein [Planomicrobium sp. Y74]|uniref:NUDIX hydrolase n=1 Tax=Planomicrobium sp. Y74 TaxID=2478977 RepID=UPI000EF4EF2E|nr:NUDIX domain-containing protein [Planomicrobium sp. Y74]RLQ90062.1 NUDIX domain-containing protein [Planomicrobium sp. Y74]
MDYIKNLRSMVGHEKVIMVIAGAFVFDSDKRLLLQQRSDTGEWGLPGGFMELDETVQDTARREVFEETGLQLKELELFGIYSGPKYDKTFKNGDQVAMVQILFTCRNFGGQLVEQNEESLSNKFYSLTELPENLFSDHLDFFKDLQSRQQLLILK